MATVTIRPNSDIAQSNATKSTGSTFYGCVDEATLDTGDYITFSAGGGYATFNWSSAGLTDETINKVRFYAIVEYKEGSMVQLMDRFEDTTRYFGYFSRVSGNSYEIELTTNPITEEAWTVSDLDDLPFGLYASNDDLKPADPILYQFYAVVDYEESAGGDDYTLSCAAGSYSQTGTAATLTYTPAAQNLTLSCGAGSLALTGSACTLSVKRNYVLSCADGSYTQTGTSASLEVKRNYVLSCSASSLTLTGSACTLSVKRNYVLSCSAGSYAVTGTSASLTKNLVMACESGGAYPNIVVSGAGVSAANGTWVYSGMYNGKPQYTFNDQYISWSGTHWLIQLYYYSTDNVATPDLVTTWLPNGHNEAVPTVTSSPATSYALIGSSVTLTKSLVLSAAAGSYTLTGSDCTLVRTGNPILACAAGSYAVTGSVVTFAITRAYTLTASAGSYTLTGSAISFGNTKAYSLALDAGSYALTGSGATFTVLRNYTLALGAGSYALTGTDADLLAQYHYSLTCSAGSYALTGTPTSLTSARSLACNSGAYVLTGLEADLFKELVMPCGNGSYILTGSPATINSARTFVLGMGGYVLVGTDAGLYIPTPTPDCRRLTIHAEDRTLTIPREDRTLKIKCCE